MKQPIIIILAILTATLAIINISLWYPDGRAFNLIAGFLNILATIILLAIVKRGD